MCQVSMYVRDGEKEELFKENVTRVELMDKAIRVSTLFEGATDIDNCVLSHIDFSAGKVVIDKL